MPRHGRCFFLSSLLAFGSFLDEKDVRLTRPDVDGRRVRLAHSTENSRGQWEGHDDHPTMPIKEKSLPSNQCLVTWGFFCSFLLFTLLGTDDGRRNVKMVRKIRRRKRKKITHEKWWEKKYLVGNEGKNKKKTFCFFYFLKKSCQRHTRNIINIM